MQGDYSKLRSMRIVPLFVEDYSKKPGKRQQSLLFLLPRTLTFLSR